MDHEMEIEVFRTGDYGVRGSYSESDLQRMAEGYDPARHEAPVTVDHLQDGPALGWVRGLRQSGSSLLARLGGMNEAFMEQLKSGAFKKRSVEFYREFEGVQSPYLKALTFLGAGAPVVKGMADPVFSDSAELLWLGFDESKDEAHVVAVDDSDAGDAAEVVSVSGADVAMSEEVTEQQEQQAQQELEDLLASGRDVAARFCERLNQEGRLLPAWSGVGEFIARLDDGAEFCFSEGVELKTLRGWFCDFLQGLSPMVPQGELMREAGVGLAVESESVPLVGKGVSIDADSLALHSEVCRYQQEHPQSNYGEALCAVASMRG